MMRRGAYQRWVNTEDVAEILYVSHKGGYLVARRIQGKTEDPRPFNFAWISEQGMLSAEDAQRYGGFDRVRYAYVKINETDFERLLNSQEPVDVFKQLKVDTVRVSG